MLVAILAGLAGLASAQSEDARHQEKATSRIVVAGDFPTTGTLSSEQLAEIGRDAAQPSEHAAGDAAAGVSLWRVLVHFGFGPKDDAPSGGDSQKLGGWKKKALVVTAEDGHQVFFSGAELAPSLGPTRAFVTWDGDAPALSVPTDKDRSRFVHHLSRIDVLDLRQLAAPALAASAHGGERSKRTQGQGP